MEGMTDAEKRGEVLRRIAKELERATALHGPMASAHEGYAGIKEELDELWGEVRKRSSYRRTDLTEEKAIQTAAMAARFVVDVIWRQR